jgi:hypothetical protein
MGAGLVNALCKKISAKLTIMPVGAMVCPDHVDFFRDDKRVVGLSKKCPVIASRSEAIQAFSVFLDCFVAIAPRNDDKRGFRRSKNSPPPRRKETPRSVVFVV